MGLFAKLVGANHRMSRMFALTGADRQIASLGEAEIRSAQARCAACTDTEACERFLETSGTFAVRPAYCLNRALIDRLTVE
jgi:hypothetical protein